MTFRPFGKIFEIETPLSAEAVRDSIYERQRSEPGRTTGPKTLVLGQLILLSTQPNVGNAEPPLICHITATEGGSRIRGYSAFSLLFGLVAAAIIASAAINTPWRDALSTVVYMAVALPLVLLLTTGDTRTNEALVRYLQNCLDRRAGTTGMAAGTAAFTGDLVLDVDGRTQPAPPTPGTLFDALMHMQEGDAGTLFLFRKGAGSLQANAAGADYILERRIDGEPGYQRASRRGAATGDDRIGRDEALAAFLAYAADEPLPQIIEWRQVAPRRA